VAIGRASTGPIFHQMPSQCGKPILSRGITSSASIKKGGWMLPKIQYLGYDDSEQTCLSDSVRSMRYLCR